jgi:hypothetical protein
VPGVERSDVAPTLERVFALDGVDSAIGLTERVVGIVLPAR